MDDGDAWEVDGIRWDTNPVHVIPIEYFDIFDIWYAALDKTAWQNGSNGAASVRWLPNAGGLNDQPAVLMDAYNILSVTSRKVSNAI